MAQVSTEEMPMLMLNLSKASVTLGMAILHTPRDIQRSRVVGWSCCSHRSRLGKNCREGRARVEGLVLIPTQPQYTISKGTRFHVQWQDQAMSSFWSGSGPSSGDKVRDRKWIRFKGQMLGSGLRIWFGFKWVFLGVQSISDRVICPSTTRMVTKRSPTIRVIHLTDIHTTECPLNSRSMCWSLCSSYRFEFLASG